MAKKSYCNRYAQVPVNGKEKDSKLHMDLLSKIGVRPIANLVYAMYELPGVKEAMDNDYSRNTLGQHYASDVLKYFGFLNIVTDITDASITLVETSKGIRDASTGQLKNFDDPLVALSKAQEINKLKNIQGESRHLAAIVVRHGRNFQVLVNPVSSYTFDRERLIDDLLFLWDALKLRMSFQGVDLDRLRVPFNDILTLEPGMINYLESMVATDNKHLSKREIEFLIASNLSPEADTLRNVFGLNAAQEAYDNYHVSRNPGYAGLIDRVINQSKALYKTLDSDFNDQTINKVSTEYSTSYEKGVKDTLSDLNLKYGIDFKEISLQDKHVKSLSEATAKAVAILETQINDLENKKGTRDDRKRLDKLHDTLMKELESKRYYLGLISYLKEANEQILGLEQRLNDATINMPELGFSTFVDAIKLARVLDAQNTYTKGYINLFRDLLEDLSNVDTLAINENISQLDIDNIKTMAKKTYDTLMSLKVRGEKLDRDCIASLLTHIMGDKVDPITIMNMTATCASSTVFTDYLYSFGKLADPICAAIGDMVRQTEDYRNEDLRLITVRIREATARLYDSGSNSEFMYEDDGHILSDYDWKKYQTALKKLRNLLYLLGIKGFELEEAMEQWEQNNTDELVVDHVSGRTERVPNSQYRKSYLGYNSFRDRLTPALLEYYDTMMQIKGEMGTLLPDWALRQFLPPLLRRDLITAIKDEGGFTPAAMKKTLNTIGEKAEELYKVKEDDTNYGINGLASYSYARGDLSGRQAKSIPIFFVHKLSNLDELLKNFSAGVLALAATALNYRAMSNVIDIALFMRQYVEDHLDPVVKDGKPVKYIAGNKEVQISFNMYLKGRSTVMMQILNNMFDKHFYNDNVKGNPYFAKFVKNLTSYTSFKGLSTNYIGATANLLVGELQLFQMALANTLHKIFSKNKTPYFGITDWALGCAKLFSAPVKFIISTVTGKNTPSVLADLITNNKQSTDYLLAEYFDLFNENYGSMMHTHYYKGARLLMHDVSFLLYGAGERAIRYNTLWAMLNSRKVQINGKTTSLRNAFQKDGYKNSPTLKLKPDVYANGICLTDSLGNLTLEGYDYMNTFKKELRYCCQGMFGAMNEEDKGVIQLYALGTAAMNFRQWMVGHYSERFRGVHWDHDKKEFVRGYYTSTGRYLRRALTSEETKDLWKDGKKSKFFISLGKDLFKFRKNWLREWTKATETERLDLMRVMSAVISYGLLFGITCFVGGGLLPKFGGLVPIGDKDEEKERRQAMTPELKFAYYQLRRLVFEADSSTPWGAFLNMETMIKSPIPALRTFDNAFYVITGLGDLGTPLEKGPDAGMDKYWRNVMKYNLPFYRDIRRFLEWEEDQTAFMMFNDNNILKF